MDTHPDRPEDLNALERRLSAWQPSSDGLAADAVLFAAGRASVRPGPFRFLWPALTVLLSVLSVGLGLWLTDERSQRLALVRLLHEPPPALTVNPSLPPASDSSPVEPPRSDELPPDSYLASRRALEEGLDAWPSRIVVRGGTAAPSLTKPPILTPGQRDALLEP